MSRRRRSGGDEGEGAHQVAGATKVGSEPKRKGYGNGKPVRLNERWGPGCVADLFRGLNPTSLHPTLLLAAPGH
jgi:hypothetical protein